MSISIGEAAKQLGMTGAGLNKWILKLRIAKRREGRTVFLDDGDFARLQTARNAAKGGKTEHRTDTEPTSNLGSISADHTKFLEDQLNTKDLQIARLQASLMELQRSSAESQRLLGEAQRQVVEERSERKKLEAAPTPEIVAIAPELVEEWQREREAIESELERILGTPACQ